MSIALNFQELFEGFQNTPLLWSGSEIYELKQFSTSNTNISFVLENPSKKLRLGNWVEQFLVHQLKQDDNITILDENLQIRHNKITVGELDLLFLKNEVPFHLEIIYKFYLYDSSINKTNSLDNWIGPNRNDTLIYKLKKLKEKQLPLLYDINAKEALVKHGIDVKDINQRVCFKAQLFLPYYAKDITINPLNSSCVTGWYISYQNIDELKGFHFYIPSKLEWLSMPNSSVDWLTFNEAKEKISIYIAINRSPLCWLKNTHNELEKCFITWW